MNHSQCKVALLLSRASDTSPELCARLMTRWFNE
jgi:hypothetical protein